MKITIAVALALAIMKVQFMVATFAVSPDPEVKCDSCCQGPAGIPGIPGSNGQHGQQGPVGPRGEVGSLGEVGVPGAKGDTGSDGLVGETGAKGDHGLKGEQGVGQPGKQGPHGLRGMDGLKGERAEPVLGSPGESGLPGAKGDIGSDGLVGEPGNKGDRGLKGNQGVGQRGKQGPRGLRGMDGLKGERGEHGPVGTGIISTRRSAFLAVRNRRFTPSSSYEPLPFEEILFSEEGTDFNLNNGTFTCTVPGIYVFMFSVVKPQNTPQLVVQLRKKSRPTIIVTVRVYAADHHQVSGSALVPMHYGEQVHLAVVGELFSYPDHDTSFTGFLLYEN